MTEPSSMFRVAVQDRVMIAHSLTGAVFGPAQQMHGATYIVDVEFRRAELDADGIVVDIGRACDVLKVTLAALNFKNLDAVPEFAGKNTTTEFLARVIFDRIAVAIRAGDLGPGAHGIQTVRVSLAESHVASGAYEGLLPPA